jgi:hypothetical protein
MQVYSPRWEQNDLYYFTKTQEGWKFENYRCKGEVDRGGNPLFYKTLVSEFIYYPYDLESYLSGIWNKVEILNKEQVQHIFDELSESLSSREKDCH